MKADEVVQQALQEWIKYEEMLNKAGDSRNNENLKISQQKANSAHTTGVIKICVASEVHKTGESTGIGLLFKDVKVVIFLSRQK